jgi:hypothetical protein
VKFITPQEFISKGYHHVPLLLSNLLFLSLFGLLALNTRLATDDFYFLSNFLEHGILEGTVVEYSTWSTRFTSVGLNHLTLFCNHQFNGALAAFTILSLVVFVLVIILNVSNILRIVLKKRNKNHRLKIVNLSVFVVSLIFISTVKIDETWFWLCATCTYLWSVMMLFLGFSWLTSIKNNWWYTLGGLFGFFYLGGASGPLAIVVLCFLITSPIYAKKLSEYFSVDSKKLKQKSLLGLVFCLIAFLILYFGKGNQVREAFFIPISIFESLILNVKMTGIIFLKRLPESILLLLLLCYPLVHWRTSSTIGKINWRQIIIITLAFIGATYLYQLSITYKTQDVGAFRALFFISVLTFIYIGILYFILAKSWPSSKVGKALFYVTLLFGPALFSYHLIEQSSLVSAYSNSYDGRMKVLQSNQQSTETITLKPLNNSGMLYSAEIAADSSNHVNVHLQKALQLKPAIKTTEP